MTRICEAQADTIVRRSTHIRIPSLPIHMLVSSRDHSLRTSHNASRCASAFLLALVTDYPEFQTGHERLFVVEPDAASDEDLEVLIEREWKGVPARKRLKGSQVDSIAAKQRKY